jgi:hypothetical protein
MLNSTNQISIRKSCLLISWITSNYFAVLQQVCIEVLTCSLIHKNLIHLFTSYKGYFHLTSSKAMNLKNHTLPTTFFFFLIILISPLFTSWIYKYSFTSPPQLSYVSHYNLLGWITICGPSNPTMISLNGKAKNLLDVQSKRLNDSAVPVSFWSTREMLLSRLYWSLNKVRYNSREARPQPQKAWTCCCGLGVAPKTTHISTSVR